MKEADKQALFSALRTVLLLAGMHMVTRGWFDAASVNEAVGAIMIIVPAVWGMWDKYQSEHRANEREVIAANAGIAMSNADPLATPPVQPSEVAGIIKAFGPASPNE